MAGEMNYMYVFVGRAPRSGEKIPCNLNFAGVYIAPVLA